LATQVGHLEVEEHHPSARGYLKVATVLFIFTMIEVAVYYIEPLRALELLAPILLVLSLLKFCGIGGWYMHLKMDHKMFLVFFAAGTCLALGMVLTLMALFGEVLESGKPIESINTALQREAIQTPGALAYQDRLGGSPIGNAELGREFWVLKGCTGCHMAPGIPDGGQIGPNQAHFSQRPTIAGGLLANTPENVEKWLKDPPAVKPGTLMPNLSLTDEQIKDLTAFLYSLP
jgi:cytochrome c